MTWVGELVNEEKALGQFQSLPVIIVLLVNEVSTHTEDRSVSHTYPSVRTPGLDPCVPS